MAITAHKFQIELGASLAGNFESSFAKGKEQIGALGRAVRDLDLQFREATAVNKLRTETDQAKQAWQEAENQLRTLALEMKDAQSPSTELSQRFEEAKLSAQQAKQAFLEKQSSLDQLTATLKANGADVDALAAKQTSLGASLQKIKQRALEMNQAFTASSQCFMGARKAMSSFVRIGVTAAAAFGAPAKKAMETEEAMIRLGNSVQVAREGGLKLLEQELNQLTKTLPYTTKELAALAEVGSNVGVKEEQLQAWTETVGRMSTALGVGTVEMGNALGKMQGTFQLTQKDVEALGDTLTTLVQDSRVQAPELIKGMVDMASAAKQFGLSATSVAGFTSAFVEMGYEAGQARTVINQLLPRLGLIAQESNKTMTEAAKSIGMVPETLKTMMKDNPEQALIYALEKINAVPLDQQAAALTNIFGQRAQAEASNLAQHVDVLKMTFASLSDQTAMAGRLQGDFNKVMQTSKGQLGLLKTAFDQTCVSLGQALMPALTNLMTSLTSVFQKIASFSQEHPKVMAFLTKGTASLLGLAAAGTLITAVIKGIGGAYYAVKGAFKAVQLVFSPEGITNIAKHPYILIGAGIASIILVVIKNWDALKEAVLKGWEAIKNAFSGAWDFIKNGFQSLKDFLAGIFDWFAEKFSFVTKSVGWVMDKAKSVGSAVSDGFNKVKNFFGLGSKEDSAQRSALPDLSPPAAHRSAVNSNNKTLNSHVNVTINAANSNAEKIAEAVGQYVTKANEGTLYDNSSFFVGG